MNDTANDKAFAAALQGWETILRKGPPKDWTKATTSELVAEVARTAVHNPQLLQVSKAAKELDRRFPVPK